MNDRFEANLLQSVVGKSSDFAAAVDAFVGQLLFEVGWGHRATDGVLFTWLEQPDDGAFGFGLLVMLDGRVEPLRVELRLRADRAGFASGLVQCGCRDLGAVGHGSAEHRQLERRIRVNRARVFAWKEQFRCDAGAWRHVSTDTS